MQTHDLVSTNECQKCCRNSTVWYPLKFKTLELKSNRQKKFGAKLSESACLCGECMEYVASTSEDWSKAWPSVIFHLVFLHPEQAVVDLLTSFHCHYNTRGSLKELILQKYRLIPLNYCLLI